MVGPRLLNAVLLIAVVLIASCRTVAAQSLAYGPPTLSHPRSELLRGQCQDFLDRPTELQASLNRALAEASLFNPFGLGHRPPSECKPAVRSSVVGLGFRRGPSAIGLAVWPIIVNPIQLHACWGWSHISQKPLKTAPLAADVDASSTVCLEGRIFGVFASPVHLSERVEFAGDASPALVSVLQGTLGYGFVDEASATLGLPPQHRLHDWMPNRSAVAATNKPSQNTLASNATNGNDSDYGPTSESLPDALLGKRSSHTQAIIPRNAVFTASEWAVFVAHSMDIATTQRCLGAGRCTEANPWLARYESPLAFTGAKFGVGLVQVYLTRKLYRAGHPRLATVANLAVATTFSAIAIRNQRIGR